MEIRGMDTRSNMGRVYLKAPGALVVSGAITFETVGALYEEGLQLLQGALQWNVYLAEVSASDSSALTLMIGWMRHLASQKIPITFKEIPAFLQDLIQIYHLNGIIKWTST